MPGKGKLQLTGQLGDVMKESAQAALSYVRTQGRDAAASTSTSSRRRDIHIHIPAGAMPKDGPSRGRHDVHRARLAAHGHPRAPRRRR